MAVTGTERFVCWTTPASAVLAAAAKNGCDNPRQANDFTDPDTHSTREDFRDLQSALVHGRNYIADGLDWWGQGYIYREEYTRRHGWVQRHKWVFTDDGIEAEEPIEN